MKTLINIWMQPVYARLNMDSRRSLYLFLSLFPIAGQALAALIYFGKGGDAKLLFFFYAFLLSLAAGLAILVFAWFVFLVMNIGMQYSPANAALVPGMKRRLQLALGVLLMVVAVLSVLITALVTHKVTMLPAFISVLFFSFFVGSMRSQWIVVPAVMTSQVPMLLDRNDLLNDNIFKTLSQGWGFEFVLFVASVSLLLGVLHWFFALSDEAHFKMHKRSLALRQGMNSREIPINQFAARFHSPFLMWMQKCIRSSQVSSRINAKLKLSPFVLGPRLHWTTIFIQLFLMISLGVMMLLLMELISGPKRKEFFMGFSVGFPAMILIGLPLFFCAYSFFTMFQTRTEQALFSLTPAVIDQRDMDRVLTHYMLRQFAILMGASLVFGFVLSQYGLELKWMNEFLSLGLSCMFMFALGMTHAFREMKAVTDHPLLKLTLVSVGLLLLGIVMTIFISSQIAWWLSSAIVITTSVTLMFRLKRNAQTVQFPVGRAVS